MVLNVPRTFHYVSAILLVTLACAAVPARQSGQRVVSQAPAEAGRQSPVEVVAVKVKGEPVLPGRPFAADDDWLVRPDVQAEERLGQADLLRRG